MSYQVLARKYRPANFEELEGQEHVLQALVNALENNRLHHAYLFTGTRGVGKTTIARILAKCLNCEQGISAKPCGECTTCREIAEGRSVDVIEVDAASRTKVEDTRELLDNVQYLPTRNRFKVYLIDEVHMLSNNSFNALLKTLEEPPPHVKFLLATTDPKKLPVTVLSRCLQFNLKNLSPERVVSYLKQILPIEGIPFDESALWQLGRAADGSMRDALSLTDQAISFGNNEVREASVKTMLGTIDQREVQDLLKFLVARDAPGILQKVSELAEFAPDYSGLVAELLSALHRIAVAQAAPAAIDNSQGDREFVLSLADVMQREDVQLFYQIGLLGRRDLPFAPDARTGFEMILLRMLAFEPFLTEDRPEQVLPEKKTVKFDQRQALADQSTVESAAPVESKAVEPATERELQPVVKPPAGKSAVKSVIKPVVAQKNNLIDRQADRQPDKQKVEPEAEQPGEQKTEKIVEQIAEQVVPRDEVPASADTASPLQAPIANNPAPTEPVVSIARNDPSTGGVDADNWPVVVASLGLEGVTLELARSCVVQSSSETELILLLDTKREGLGIGVHPRRIADAIKRQMGWEVKVKIETGIPDRKTPADIEEEKNIRLQQEAVELIHNDVKVKRLIEKFDGRLNEESITARKQVE